MVINWLLRVQLVSIVESLGAPYFRTIAGKIVFRHVYCIHHLMFHGRRERHVILAHVGSIHRDDAVTQTQGEEQASHGVATFLTLRPKRDAMQRHKAHHEEHQFRVRNTLKTAFEV